MKRLVLCALTLCLGTLPVAAQSLDDLNIQIHGYATQGFLYSNHNNYFTTHSSDGSPAWTEAVVNVTAQPTPKLRVGVQARYFLLGNFGNQITLDWALGDYKFNDKFGVRFGKVKTPQGLFNETQDIDPSYMWSLLPQSVYPIGSRNTLLSHYGGVVYGALRLGKKGGKLEYRGWGGQRVLAGDDGYTLSQREQGINLPTGLSFTTYGGTIRWLTPVQGLMFGVSDSESNKTSAPVTIATTINQTPVIQAQVPGVENVNHRNTPYFYGKYEHDKIMVAAEYARVPISGNITVPSLSVPTGGRLGITYLNYDDREWYVMASYKITSKLNFGVYVSQLFDHAAPLGPARFSKDWAVSGRYDFTSYLYVKAEQHFIDGTNLNVDATLNPVPAPSAGLTLLKVGVSF
jgi:hypothetical protein